MLFSFQVNQYYKVASPEFHTKHVIPLQKKFEITEKPIICLLSKDNHAGLSPTTEPIYFIIIGKNDENEGSLSDLAHEMGHIYCNEIKIKLGLKLDHNPGIINYILKMNDNFIGGSFLTIISIFLCIMSKKYLNLLVTIISSIPIIYGHYRIVIDIIKGHQYNRLNRQEELLCDIFVSKIYEEQEKKDLVINEYINSLLLLESRTQSFYFCFLEFLVGKTHPSTNQRIKQLKKLKKMSIDKIDRLLKKIVKEILYRKSQ